MRIDLREASLTSNEDLRHSVEFEIWENIMSRFILTTNNINNINNNNSNNINGINDDYNIDSNNIDNCQTLLQNVKLKSGNFQLILIFRRFLLLTFKRKFSHLVIFSIFPLFGISIVAASARLIIWSLEYLLWEDIGSPFTPFVPLVLVGPLVLSLRQPQHGL